MAKYQLLARRRAVTILGALLALTSVMLSAGPAGAAVPDAPASCTATVAGSNIGVGWPAVGGASEYIVYRSVDGGTEYWRGRTSSVSFTDSNRSGVLVYSVASKSGAGEVSARTTCTNGGEPPPPLDFVVVGDMVECNAGGAVQVSALLDQIPGTILGVGDFVYNSGSQAEFANCFDPIMGRHKSRFDPVAGNHEYYTPGAVPYFNYFGSRAGDPAKGYYEKFYGNWQILYLNSNCAQVGGCNSASPQYQWLQQRLNAAPVGVCRIAVMHHPRYTADSGPNDYGFVGPFQQLLYDAGTDLVLAGHSHYYERLAKVAPNGTPDQSGIRNFAVGTGGALFEGPVAPLAIGESLILDTYGVLDLDLGESSYQWSFVDIGGNTLDQGSDNCLSNG